MRSSTRWAAALASLLLVALLLPAQAIAQAARPSGEAARPPAPTRSASSPTMPGDEHARTGSLTLVGHNPLLNRGMNAAIAIHGKYAYIGSRTDTYGNPELAGIMIVDISNPARPRIVGKLGQPQAGNPGESTRELRVWPSQNVLVVLNTNCGGRGAHECIAPSRNDFRFFDISGANATSPKLITKMDEATHEFFLWVDPEDSARALMFGGSAGAGPTAFSVWDISPVAKGLPPVTVLRSTHGYTAVPAEGAFPPIPQGGLHSLSISNDGTRAYFALLSGGFAVTDVSDFTAGRANPQLRLITGNADRPVWPGPGTHSAIKLFGREVVYTSDEVYGSATAAGHGCPWGWARTIDITEPEVPVVQGEYKLEQNFRENCRIWEPRPRTSYSAHNPTATPNIVFTTWHAGGVQAISVADPRNPYQLAEFLPTPLRSVAIEDPRLSSDPDTGKGERVVMWSFPIIKDGLIYVVDVRNGLYVLKYDGPSETEVDLVTFLEGNSNLGHALCFEPVDGEPSYCDDRRAKVLVGSAFELLRGMGLRSGIVRPLENELRAVQRAMEQGQDRAACRSVSRFIDLVDARERQGERRGLSRRQASQLWDAAETLGYALGCRVV